MKSIKFKADYKVTPKVSGKLNELVDRKLLVRMDKDGNIESSNKELTLIQIMSQNPEETRKSLLDKLGLVNPAFILEREPGASKERIKQAKKDNKLSIKSNSLIQEFFNHKLPNWGSLKINEMKINTL